MMCLFKGALGIQALLCEPSDKAETVPSSTEDRGELVRPGLQLCGTNHS